MLDCGILVGAVGKLADQCANLVDDLSMICAHRRVRISVLGIEFHCSLQRVFDFPAVAVFQRLQHRNTLAVASRCIGILVVGIWIFRLGLYQRARQFHRILKVPHLGCIFGFQMRCVDGRRFGCNGAAVFCGRLKIACMKLPPRFLNACVLRIRLVIAHVQGTPILFQRVPRVGNRFLVMRKFIPFRHVSPRSKLFDVVFHQIPQVHFGRPYQEWRQ